MLCLEAISLRDRKEILSDMDIYRFREVEVLSLEKQDIKIL